MRTSARVLWQSLSASIQSSPKASRLYGLAVYAGATTSCSRPGAGPETAVVVGLGSGRGDAGGTVVDGTADEVASAEVDEDGDVVEGAVTTIGGPLAAQAIAASKTITEGTIWVHNGHALARGRRLPGVT
jgi:hypothetical protein